MTKHTVECPICHIHFFPDAMHRFSGTCSAICARQQTTGTRFTTNAAHIDMTVIAKPIAPRKHGRDNREASNE